MKLEYKILWFEDEDTWYQSILPFISRHLNQNGFELEPIRRKNGHDLHTLIQNQDFDLILMDYNLSGIQGEELIESIRDNQLYTDIIFYSQTGAQAVRNIAKDKGLDGVFCSGRDNMEFVDKVKKVIQTTIRKVQDVNNLRGLVMAETSELDEKMIDIIEDMCKMIPDNKKLLLEKTIENREERLCVLKGITCDDMERDSLSRTLESSDRLKAINRLVKGVKESPLSDYVEILHLFENEILKIRNVLAHVKEENDLNGRKVLKSKIKGYESFEFNDEICSSIRNNIRKHADNLENIHKNIYSYIYKNGATSSNKVVAPTINV
jgi:DNA-binding response OmpR family regulator